MESIIIGIEIAAIILEIVMIIWVVYMLIDSIRERNRYKR
jgi:hypothetical protein